MGKTIAEQLAELKLVGSFSASQAEAESRARLRAECSKHERKASLRVRDDALAAERERRRQIRESRQRSQSVALAGHADARMRAYTPPAAFVPKDRDEDAPHAALASLAEDDLATARRRALTRIEFHAVEEIDREIARRSAS